MHNNCYTRPTFLQCIGDFDKCVLISFIVVHQSVDNLATNVHQKYLEGYFPDERYCNVRNHMCVGMRKSQVQIKGGVQP